MPASPISQLIDYLQLPPTSSSLALLGRLKKIHHGRFTSFYLEHKTGFVLVHSDDNFRITSPRPIMHLRTFPSLPALETYLATI